MFAARIEIVVVHQLPLAEDTSHVYAVFGAMFDDHRFDRVACLRFAGQDGELEQFHLA